VCNDNTIVVYGLMYDIDVRVDTVMKFSLKVKGLVNPVHELDGPFNWNIKTRRHLIGDVEYIIE